MQFNGNGTPDNLNNQQGPRFSFSELAFGNPGEALLNSAMPRPPGMMMPGPGISELLHNQMPSHKMSIDFTN